MLRGNSAKPKRDRIVVYTLAVIVVFEAAFLGFMFTLTRPW